MKNVIINKAVLSVENSLITKAKLEQELSKIVTIIDKNMERFSEKFPSPCTNGKKYQVIDNIEWTNGFWTGILWLAYEITNDNKYKQVAERNVESFLDRIKNNIETDHHDLGFLYSLSCVSAYKLTGNTTAKLAALLAADKLLGRYQEKGAFIQAWGELGVADNYRLIIDCLLNIPLLYWAFQQTNNAKYLDVANMHYQTTIQHAIRENFSTFHTFYFDPKTGSPLKGITRQGFSDESSWARGQAWAIYGVALQYKENPTEKNLSLFKEISNYFINKLPKDYIPYWDLIFDDTSNHPKDSSAAAIAICGLDEMYKSISESDQDKAIYKKVINLMLNSLIDNYSNKNIKEDELLIDHGVYSWHSGKGVDEGNIWGDYFYFEAIVRLYKNWQLYW